MTTILTDDQLKEEVGKLAGGQEGVMPKSHQCYLQ